MISPPIQYYNRSVRISPDAIGSAVQPRSGSLHLCLDRRDSDSPTQGRSSSRLSCGNGNPGEHTRGWLRCWSVRYRLKKMPFGAGLHISQAGSELPKSNLGLILADHRGRHGATTTTTHLHLASRHGLGATGDTSACCCWCCCWRLRCCCCWRNFGTPQVSRMGICEAQVPRQNLVTVTCTTG